MFKPLIVLLICLLLSVPALGRIEMNGGWSVTSEGQVSSSGQSQISSALSGDPTITLGVVSSSSLYGPGNANVAREGSLSEDLGLGGFGLSISFDGEVTSEVILTSSGTASAAAFVGATATGLPTGLGSYEIFGTADVTTDGFLHGMGSAVASASGSSSYGVTRDGSISEVWGEAQGISSTTLTGSSTDSFASTGGKKNGIQAESNVIFNSRGEVSDSSTSTISAYASAINSATADVSVSGIAQSGGWDPTATLPKTKLANEIVTSTSSGTLTGEAIAPGSGDASDISATLEVTANRNSVLNAGLQKGLIVSGGPSTYASTLKSSNSGETFAHAKIENALWGSVARQTGRTALEWGKVDTVECGVIAKEAGGSGLTFAKIFMTTDLLERGGVFSSSGNMTIATLGEVSGSKNAVAGARVFGSGQGDMWTADGFMRNSAGYVGGIDHYSYVSSEDIVGQITNIATNAFISVEPKGTSLLGKPNKIDTTVDPMYAWASTEGWYYQAH